MKEVRYGARLTENRDMHELAKQRTEQLEDFLGAHASEVSAEWDLGEKADARPVITLRLSDWTGFATAVFDPKELESLPEMRFRFNRVWSNLLRVRSHKLLADLIGTGAAAEGT